MRSQPSHRAARFSPRLAARACTALACAGMSLTTPFATGAQVASRFVQAATQVATQVTAPGLAAVPAPDPGIAPDAVVTIVLDAFAHMPDADDDAPAPGLDVAYAFTAPANRASIGSVERFSDVVRDRTYRPLLGHRHAVRSEMRIDGDRATQRVVVTSTSGARVAYTFTLSRQVDGAYKGCWMTERVQREPPSMLSAPQLALGRPVGSAPIGV